MALWRRLRALPTWILPVALGAVLLMLPVLGLDFSASRQIQLACILALLVSGLNLSLGYAGELALGQAAMYAAGAYTAGMLSAAGHTDIAVQLAASGLVVLAVGLLTGVAGLRLGSWSLAMTSFFLVLLVPDVLAVFAGRTGGRNGLSGILGPTLFGRPLDPTGFYLVIGVVLVAWFAVMRNIVVSRHGVALRVLKQSPVLASSMGISAFRMKLLAYALGAIPAGLAGALFANLDLYVSPEAFGFTLATTVLAASILGGTTSVYGALAGAAVMQFGPSQSSRFQEFALVFTGVFLIVGGVLVRGGLADLARKAVTRLDRAAGLTPQPASGTEGTADIPPIKGATLAVEDVSKAFGGNRALDGVNFRAAPGRVTALIGPNGSGKTTLLNMVCGFYRTDSGRILLDGERLEGATPHRVARAGVARTFQTPSIPDGVTVLEAVAAGRYSTDRASVLSAVLRLPGFRRVRRADREEAERMLALVGMGHLRGERASALPLGMRRLLEVARSLIAAPGVLLLDEAASGLDEDEVDRLAELIRRIRAAGGTVVLVEHNFRLVLDLADDIVVLAHGQVIAQGPPAEIETNPRVLGEYLGAAQEVA
ncbi:amino acid/amide ABC transporter membrane protein 2, HAAT family /amino acid/amide ABC transporter ATP-binding protein 1, HAAT family [Thermomonospora echinospora]|uniref:Amino acid/amide ABC transporter membrane protein 2, HAAT family /amino acid/amide ABC transporter ATP-binding protein 1, HAAT family n=1 Tax=Thermomonospora echinospora TaxID=1992 RepID=A0A1H6E7K1_9ACTN|nr:branched-chain amino acid ABC transporter ATP-binding protein/permease [Thermomonospora echinospora]SEG93690.1 amino acid/amide ABC transporter membrane protein 2, HAAT family /amino acid/amide ABC transporter ATP-binding protein 1, HAAT family [Thermomonospora echinospora]